MNRVKEITVHIHSPSILRTIDVKGTIDLDEHTHRQPEESNRMKYKKVSDEEFYQYLAEVVPDNTSASGLYFKDGSIVARDDGTSNKYILNEWDVQNHLLWDGDIKFDKVTSLGDARVKYDQGDDIKTSILLEKKDVLFLAYKLDLISESHAKELEMENRSVTGVSF